MADDARTAGSSRDITVRSKLANQDDKAVSNGAGTKSYAERLDTHVDGMQQVCTEAGKNAKSRFHVARVDSMTANDVEMEAGYDGNGATVNVINEPDVLTLTDDVKIKFKNPRSGDEGHQVAFICPKENEKVSPPQLIGMIKHRDRQDSEVSDSYNTDVPTSPTDTYDTRNLKTFGHNTHEALPHVDHYRNQFSTSAAFGLKLRPTLDELHEEKDEDLKYKEALLKDDKGGKHMAGDVAQDKEKKGASGAAVKFGWITGVLVRCLLNIWGVMLFLRLSWVVGQAGIGLCTVVILLSAVVTTITALSMSAICTNGEVKGGGAYYLISRSLGPEFGGAIGLIFSVANTVAVAMYVVGFAEKLRDILKEHDALMVDEDNDIRIIGFITVVILLIITLVGMEWESRAQLFLLGILIVALVNFIIGSFLTPSLTEQSQGFVGYKGSVFSDNFPPAFRDGEDFFSVFSIFFPAATGILAGANISGNLQDAQKAIPKGTILAIVLSSAVYILVAWQLGSCVLRDAAGLVDVNATGEITMAIGNCSVADGGCSYGLMNDFQVMDVVAGFGPLITAGVFSATLSSALASLVSAPKVFQAVCMDRIFPWIHVFAKEYGKSGDPRRAYILTFIIALGFIAIGELNAIAPIISNFFLMSYALINYSCFDASLARSPGWRPAFRYYSMWSSLLGALLCLAVMFIINWWTALITFVVVAALYIYVHYSKPDVNWGSSTQAHVYRNALMSTLKLVDVHEHVKNYRPQILVLSGMCSYRPALIDFASHITSNISLLVCGNILIGNQGENVKFLRTSAPPAYRWLHKRKVKAFYNVVTAPDFRLGVQTLMQTSGVGKMRPNILLMGFKSNWRHDTSHNVEDYFHIIHDAFDLQLGLGILRVREGFDCSADLAQCQDSVSMPDEESIVVYDETTPHATPVITRKQRAAEPPISPSRSLNDFIFGKHGKISKDLDAKMNLFNRKQKKGTIDVWWLFDDGGLTLLLPYLLTKSHWSNCKLRVFTAATKKGDLDRDQRQMVTLLNKFRIDVTDMVVLPDVGKAPQDTTKAVFQELLKGRVLDEKAGETEEDFPWKTSDAELALLRDKTNRHMRLRELLFEHSFDASLIVMTLPMPRKGTCSSALYMAWLETLTAFLPPVLLLRGNQTSVLTYYS